MKLKDRYEAMTPEQRVAFANKVGMSPAYLWQLANRWDDRKPSIKMIRRLIEADKKLKLSDLIEEFSA